MRMRYSGTGRIHATSSANTLHTSARQCLHRISLTRTDQICIVPSRSLTDDMPLVSIIVPVYNVAAYLRESLDSICRQTLQDIEIICINDGSTDASLNILQEYSSKDSRFRIISQPNGGVSSARNTGLRASTGEYIGFVDPDDYIHPYMFERMACVAKSKNADVVECSVKLIHQSDPGLLGGILQQWHDVPTQDVPDFRYEGIHQTLVYLWNKIYRREMLEKNDVRFIEGMTGEDLVFNASALPACRALFRIDDVLYYYRYGRPASITKDYTNLKKAEQTYATLLQQMVACSEKWQQLGIFDRVGKSLLPLVQHLFQNFFFKLPASARKAGFHQMQKILLLHGWTTMLQDPEFGILRNIANGRYAKVVWIEFLKRKIARSKPGYLARQLAERAAISLAMHQR